MLVFPVSMKLLPSLLLHTLLPQSSSAKYQLLQDWAPKFKKNQTKKQQQQKKTGSPTCQHANNFTLLAVA